MDVFSYSKIKLFGECPYAYKLKYIDQLKVEKKETTEQFAGRVIHSALQYLHEKVMEKKKPGLFQVLSKFELDWNKLFDEKKLVINTNEDLKQNAFDIIENYYNKHFPFSDDKTVALEKKVEKEYGDFKIIGYIDRLEDAGDKIIIHDYKTGKTKYLDEDQLKLYHLLLNPQKNAEYVWHFLNLNDNEKRISDLTGFEQTIIEKIKQIKSARSFEKKEGKKCRWCVYKNTCMPLILT